MHKVAVLLDGGHVLFELSNGNTDDPQYLPTASRIEALAHLCYYSHREDLFRIYYYDCPPFGGSLTHPITNIKVNYTKNPLYRLRERLYRELAQSKNFAFRAGQLKFRGWTFKKSALKLITDPSQQLSSDHLKPQFQQKGVDIKIGLDISWLASKKIVDRIILFTGDTDFVPAMKFARREGVQVVLATLRDKINPALREHSDEVRKIKAPPAV